MSPRSRHAPLPAARKQSNGTGSHIPRYQPRTGSETASFSTVSRHTDLGQANFSLSSSASGSRQRYEPCHWDSSSSAYRKDDDDYVSVAGYNSLNVSESCYSISMMTGTDAMDATYDLAAGEILSRHAPLSTTMSPPGQSAQILSQDVAYDDYLPMDFNHYNYNGTWPNRGFTPPPESYLEAALPQYGMPSSLYDDFCTVAQDDAACELLGPSKLLSYSGSRHSAVQPRPIRSASERTEVHISVNDDLNSRTPPEDFIDKVKARNDPLYDTKPDKDGLYHCPLVSEFKCSHKPTKQKCIYAKYLDSHLRPYRCKYPTAESNCEDARFSSNACLFRHEREAHGMHNHGKNPYLCDFPDCDRAKPGYGFPRRWNQRDHMKRVHGWIEEDSTSPPDRQSSTDLSKRRKGSGGPSSVQMRRSGSSYAKAQTVSAAYSRDSRCAMNVSRHEGPVSFVNPLQTGNVLSYSNHMDVQYSQAAYPRESRHSQPYARTYYQAAY